MYTMKDRKMIYDLPWYKNTQNGLLPDEPNWENYNSKHATILHVCSDYMLLCCSLSSFCCCNIFGDSKTYTYNIWHICIHYCVCLLVYSCFTIYHNLLLYKFTQVSQTINCKENTPLNSFKITLNHPVLWA